MIDISAFNLYNKQLLGQVADQSFNESIELINSMPEFFQDSLQWGLDSSYAFMGFMSVLALSMALFKR